MLRVHFHLFNDAVTYDEDGSEFPDIVAAKAAAIKGVRGLIAEHVAAGRPIDLNHHIDIVDEHGRTLSAIPFREVLTIVDTRRGSN